MISQKMKKLVEGSSAIRAMFEEGKKMIAERGEENVFDFSLGNPSIVPPDTVKKAMLDVIENEDTMTLHGYMNNAGFESTRQALADSLNKRFNAGAKLGDIVVTVGAAGGLNVALRSLINPGEEVMILAPFFGEYTNYIANVDGTPVIISPMKDFGINITEIEAKITEKTRCIIINSPNNPTGRVYTEDELKSLADLLAKKQKEFKTSIYIIADEPYREIVFGGRKAPFIPAIYPNTIVGYSFAKSLSLPGERIGYIYLPKSVDDYDNILGAMTVANRILGFVNAPSFMQKVIERVVDETADISVYEDNKNVLCSALKEYGYELNEPQGTFYAFPKSPIEDDKKFCADAKEYGLVIVPGSSFGAPGYFRIAFCVKPEKVKASLPAFKKAIERYKK